MIRALTGYSTRNPWKVITLWVVLGISLALLSPVLLARVTQSQCGDFLHTAAAAAGEQHSERVLQRCWHRRAKS
ncbi:hypothetical protein [Kitasatospora sp. NPDC127116]|uniref:hypothetical protein n=1 Tax=Kitasatospora sp. NPDC127116 TaxID=3345367 RepID=UPI0036250AD6